MRVDIETVIGFQKWRDQINRLDLNEIEFFENDIELNISKAKDHFFRFTGLNNLDFITSGAYKE